MIMQRKNRTAPDARGMRGSRSRVEASGRLRKKRADTKIETIEKQYGRKLAAAPVQLKTVLKQKKKPSLKKLLA